MMKIKTFEEYDMAVLERKVNDYLREMEKESVEVEIIASYYTGKRHCVVLKTK